MADNVSEYPQSAKTEALTEKVLQAANTVEAKAIVQEVKSTVASEATILAIRRKNQITLLKERTQTFLAISITCATITAAFTQPEIDETLKSAIMIVLGYFLRDSEKVEKPLRDQHTRSTDR